MAQEDLFRQAKLLYEAAQKVGGFAADPHEIAEKMKQLAAGLPAEDEFGCFAAWSLRCPLVHKLDQDQIPASSKKVYQVPDFLMAFKCAGADLAVLVEVKTSSFNPDEDGLHKDLRFSGRYYQRLANYAALVRLPLLIAWKAGPLGWTLFDIRRMSVVSSAYRITLDMALKENLLGVLIGDFGFTLPEKTALSMTIKRLTPITGGEFVGRVEDVAFENRAGERFKSLLWPFFEMFAYTTDDVEVIEEKDLMVQRFYKVATESVWAQWLLYPACHGFGAKDPDWRKALVQQGFRYHLPDVLEAAIDAGKKGLVETVIHQVPHTIPDFLGGSYDSLKKTGLLPA